jgi:HPt (histidine-containing phosphotransfer) domain-containing protein
MRIAKTARRADIGDMRRRLGDDDALIADLFRLFLEECPLQLGRLQSAVDSRRLDEVRRAAHMLKGSAGNLSAFQVVAAAAALEDAAERGQASDVDGHFATVTTNVCQLVAELRELLAGDAGASTHSG